MAFARFCVIALISLTVLGCAQSPTGRTQIKLFPAAQLDQMGDQAFTEMKTQQKISNEPIVNDYVQCIADKITEQVPESTFAGKWEVIVFDEDQINAFALPGGKIGVYAGLLKIVENQHQLAAVIGHEVAHVIAEHGNERMSSGTLINLGLDATNAILQTNRVSHSKELMAAIGLGVQVGLQLPFGRSHESEADLIGLDLMSKAGFKPQESIKLWQNMDKASSGNRPPEFFSTHPSPDTRIQQLEANMANAKVLYRVSKDKAKCDS